MAIWAKDKHAAKQAKIEAGNTLALFAQVAVWACVGAIHSAHRTNKPDNLANRGYQAEAPCECMYCYEYVQACGQNFD